MGSCGASEAITRVAVAALRSCAGDDLLDSVANVLVSVLKADVVTFHSTRQGHLSVDVVCVDPARGEVGSLLHGMAEQLAIALPVPDGGESVWLALRECIPFGDVSRDLADHLRPLLAAVEECRRAHPGDRGAMSSPSASPAQPEQLTPRENAVLKLLAEGLTAGAIAHNLSISPRTVSVHLQSIYRKLGVRDRLSAVLRAQTGGFLR